MIEVLINSVYQYEDDKNTRIRIIRIFDNSVYYVELNNKKSFPKLMELTLLESKLESGEIIEIKDPFAIVIDENTLTELEKQKRDLDYRIIMDLCEYNDDIFDLSKRYSIIIQISKKYNLSVDTIKRMYIRYLTRGMNKNALLKDYKKCGGKGKDKKLSQLKVGRPNNNYSEYIVGVNIDDCIKELICKVYNSQYLTKNKKSYKECYYYLLQKYFSDKIVEEGVTSYIVWDQNKIPTYQQFKYWCKKFKDDKNEFIKREGERKYLGVKRELLDTSNNVVFGPGSVYQVDATIADVQLLSDKNKSNNIGRPIVYYVIDVFSRLIVGFYVGLEGPSWIGAMMAMDNVVQNKVEFCKNYNVDITAKEWPNSYLPQELVCDRGEFEGYNPDNLINNLNVNVNNKAAYRGDLKGIVERRFRTLNDRLKQANPGAVKKQLRERGERPYTLEARLNLYDFIRECLYLVIEYNNSIIEKYERDYEMISSCILAVPALLWDWGFKYRRTGVVKRDRDLVQLNLLPKLTGTITRKGIRVKSRLYYSCQRAIEEQWFIKSINKKLNIVYDPRCMNQVYIINENGDSYEVCMLTDACKMYRDLSIYEFNNMVAMDNAQKASYDRIQLHYKINSSSKINEIVRNACKMYEEPNESDAFRNSSIRENRENEKSYRRKEEVFDLSKSSNTEEAIIIDINKNIDEVEYNNNLKSSNKLSLLKEIRDDYNNG